MTDRHDSVPTATNNCGSCGVEPGQKHGDFCSVSRCPTCGLQAIACSKHSSSGMQVWTGEYPGYAECREFGWLDAAGQPDLTRFTDAAQFGMIRWDRAASRFRQRA